MARFDVKYAVYGALQGGSISSVIEGEPASAGAFNVSSQLSSLLNASGATAVVQCGNGLFGDPSPGNQKHFGAVVSRGGTNLYFACEEGQTIDFNHGGGTATSSALEVKFAVYGALPGGDESAAQAFDVTGIVQAAVNESGGTVVCGNATFGDPSFGNNKHFAAVVKRGGTDFYFACAEGQIIDFNFGGGS